MPPIQNGPMTDLHRLVDEIGRTRDCKILARSGTPVLREGDRLPEDLAAFYQLAGGAAFFEHSDYTIRVVGPEEFRRANPELVGSDCPEDISDAWYIVARGGLEEVITIDCSADRLGRCYHSFYQRAVPHVDVPAELFNQWDDCYFPEDKDFQSGFVSAELAVLARFDNVLNQVSDDTPQALPALDEFLTTQAWRTLSDAAQDALSAFSVAQDS